MKQKLFSTIGMLLYLLMSSTSVWAQDFTSSITNPSFEDGTMNGWTHYGYNPQNAEGERDVTANITPSSAVDPDGVHMTNTDGERVCNFQLWAWSGWWSYYNIYQTVNLPAGNYELKAVLSSHEDRTMTLFAGDPNAAKNDANSDFYKYKTTLTTTNRETGQEATLNFTLNSQQSISIGAGYVNVPSWWEVFFKVDNFRLTRLEYLGEAAAAGEYYIYNLASKRFLNQGSSWGTHAIVDGAGEPITLIASGNAYQLKFANISGEKYMATDGYVDGGTSEDRYTTWRFEAVAGFTNVYKIIATKNDNGLYWAGGSGRWGNNVDVGDVSGKGNEAYWILVKKSDRENYATATANNPVDMTWKVKNPDMEGDDNDVNQATTSWTTSGSFNFTKQYNGPDGTMANFVEKWAGEYSPTGVATLTDGVYYLNDCETEQTLISLPEGHYRLSIDAMATQQSYSSLAIEGVKLFAGSNKTALSGRGNFGVDFVSDGGNVTVGVDVANTNANWVYFDNVRLDYYGPIAIPLPNNTTTELTVGQWYYYDATHMGPYQLEGQVGNIVYTQDGNNILDNSAVTKNAQSKLILNSGRTYFKATASGATLKITSVTDEGSSVTFTAASLNVDGLPAKISFVNINPDGRGASGATQIGKYLMMNKNKYDLIALEEDFSYHSYIADQMTVNETYGFGTHRGTITATAIVSPANTDGLEFCWNKANGREASNESWTKYNSVASTDGNQYIQKGYRYYEVTLEEGMTIDVYVTHMDAGDTEGENGSMVSRGKQLTQLANAIIANPYTNRPKLILGDTNCRYWRDAVTANLIDPINQAGHFVIKDAFVEQENGGNYPYVGGANIAGEVVDKIFYLNPTATGAPQLIFELFWKETDYVENTVENNGVMDPLGDHPPVVARFRMEKPALQLSDIKDRWEWTGETIQYGDIAVNNKNYCRWYLYNVNYGRWDSGRNGFLTSDGTLVRDPNLSNVHRFSFYGNGSGASISNEYNKLRVYLSGVNYKAGLLSASESGATTFKVFDTNDSESNPDYADGVNLAYHFKGHSSGTQDRLFAADSPTELSAHQNPSKLNAWALISQDQLLVYNRYCKAWDKGNIYLTFLPLDDTKRDALTALLQRTGVRWTDTTTADLEALNAQIEEWFDDNLTTRIVNPSFELDSNGDQLTTNGTYTNYVVPGWTVPNDVDEAFISNKNVSGGEGSSYWSRYFDDADGNYVFNTFNNGAAAPNDFYVRQTITGLPEGFYKLKAVATTDTGNSITLEMGSSTFTTPVDQSRPTATHLELPLYYHDGESSLTIGASSKTWFEIDNFKLLRYDYYYDETITDAEYATTAIRYNTEVPTGVEVYYATAINPANGDTGGKVRDHIHLEKHNGKIAAGEGVILYMAGNNASRQFRFYRTDESVERINGNMLTGTIDYIPANQKRSDGTYYMLGKKTITYDKRIETVDDQTGEVTYSTVETTEPVVGFYEVMETAGIKAHKAYLFVSNNPGKGYLFSFDDDDTTPITVGQTTHDGKIAAIYSLGGARQNELKRGLNIVRMSDGSVKKIMVK